MTEQATVLERYARPVAHMFRQFNEGRFGLILGSGVNRALGCPDWAGLVERISEHPEVNGTVLRREANATPLPILAQVLYQHFRRKYEEVNQREGESAHDTDRRAAAAFRRVIHDCLYRDVPAEDDPLISRDRFYRHYLDVVKRSPLTVTYNFDDSLERILLATRTDQEKRTSRGFETITDARLQFRSKQGIIYHPNGYLPRSPLEAPADTLVFSEGSFADQLIDTMSGHFSSLLHHLSKNTCLLVGLSLDDATLRHLLRQHSKINPGHYHYFVHFMPDGESPPLEEQRARRDANFEVFNLVTLFLSERDIAELGRLLSLGFEQIRAEAEEVGARVSYCFYLTGVPGVGKTTTSSYFKSLVAYDEWLERRLPEMGRPHVSLSPEERQRVDTWVREQVALKNYRLLTDNREKGVGITIVDRCVPDALAFTPPGEWASKANDLLETLSPGKATRPVRPGHVILLLGEPKELSVRSECRGKQAPAEYIEKLQADTHNVYYKPGITKLWTAEMSVLEVVKAVARIIHLQEYEECDLQELLVSFAQPAEAVQVL